MSNITEVDFSTPAHDIPRMLRQRAKAIENGEVNPISVVLVEYYGHGDTEVYGYGHQLTPGQAYMLLDHGKLHLLDLGA